MSKEERGQSKPATQRKLSSRTQFVIDVRWALDVMANGKRAWVRSMKVIVFLFFFFFSLSVEVVGGFGGFLDDEFFKFFCAFLICVESAREQKTSTKNRTPCLTLDGLVEGEVVC
jgi:hypothetical protein